MAVKDNGVTTPKSTGKVKPDTKPVTTEQVADPSPTGAVETSQEFLGETTADYHGADAVVRYDTPSEPVTMSVSWLSEDSGPQEESSGQANSKAVTADEPGVENK